MAVGVKSIGEVAEIVHEIMSFCHRATLVSCVRVNHLFHNEAARLLWQGKPGSHLYARQVTVLVELAKTAGRFRHYIRFVKAVYVYFGPRDHITERWLEVLQQPELWALAEIQNVKIVNFSEDVPEHERILLTLAGPALRSLILHAISQADNIFLALKTSSPYLEDISFSRSENSGDGTGQGLVELCQNMPFVRHMSLDVKMVGQEHKNVFNAVLKMHQLKTLDLLYSTPPITRQMYEHSFRLDNLQILQVHHWDPFVLPRFIGRLKELREVMIYIRENASFTLVDLTTDIIEPLANCTKLQHVGIWQTETARALDWNSLLKLARRCQGLQWLSIHVQIFRCEEPEFSSSPFCEHHTRSLDQSPPNMLRALADLLPRLRELELHGCQCNADVSDVSYLGQKCPLLEIIVLDVCIDVLKLDEAPPGAVFSSLHSLLVKEFLPWGREEDQDNLPGFEAQVEAEKLLCVLKKRMPRLQILDQDFQPVDPSSPYVQVYAWMEEILKEEKLHCDDDDEKERSILAEQFA